MKLGGDDPLDLRPRTKTGRVLTDADIEKLSAEARGATVWNLTGVPHRGPVNLALAVDTQDPGIVELIERAANDAGIVLVREDVDVAVVKGGGDA